MSDAGGHYFAEQPSVASRPESVELWLPDMHLRLSTDRGVFGHGTIDPGTRLLLSRGGEPRPSGLIVDVGCGTGAIAITLARRAPAATVWAVDINARARALCAENAAVNGVSHVRVLAPEEVPADCVVDEIWSNPPIRIGKPALHELLLTWLDRLAPSGVAHLVVHKHLGSDSLQRWIEAQGWPCQRTVSSGGYRLLRISVAADRPQL
jgi:16S rRNA (guanine1207-N2)-methyltransferase